MPTVAKWHLAGCEPSWLTTYATREEAEENLIAELRRHHDRATAHLEGELDTGEATQLRNAEDACMNAIAAIIKHGRAHYAAYTYTIGESANA